MSVLIRVVCLLAVLSPATAGHIASEIPSATENYKSHGQITNKTDTMVDVGTHRLHAVVLGKGTPVVVFDGGVATPSGDYSALQERIAPTTTVVTYDRAGYGSSEVGPLPRDSRQEAEELRALLSGLDLRGPYILVGHSLGGLNVQVYAGLHPDEVAGLVLLDPPPSGFILGKDYAQMATTAEQMTNEWQNIADQGLNSEDEQERHKAAFFRMLASEHREMFETSARYAASLESFGDIPLVVIASGVPNTAFGQDAEAFQQYWVNQSKALAGKSSHGHFILAEKSTHKLYDDAADVVAESILSMVKSLRDGK